MGAPAEVPTPPGCESRDLGNAVLLPGFVNTHTHLELTCLRGLVTAKPFFTWVGTVKRLKEQLSDDDYRASARWGVLENFAAGVTTIGDTGSSLAPARAMSSLGARGVAYHEVFGPHPDQLRASMDALAIDLLELDGLASDRLAIGVSPHAPYTVSEALLEEVVQLAFEDDRPLAMHLAESPEEWELFTQHAGAMAEMFRTRGIPLPEGHETPAEWAASLMMPELRALLIHCVHATDDDLWLIRDLGAAVAHCPWSNDALGVGRMRLAEMLAQGITVGLGTDSVAPGRGIDMFAEMRAGAGLAELPPGRRLSLATLEAAQALGVADVGMIANGAWADLCAVSCEKLPSGADDDIVAAVLEHSSAADVLQTWVAGRLVYDRGTWPGVDIARERGAIMEAEERARSIAL